MGWEVRTASLLLYFGILLLAIYDVTAERRIVCYYTNWSVYRPGSAKFSPQNINPYLCTHLIYAFGGFTKENTLKPFDKYQDIEKGGYAKFTGLKTYNKNLKTMLAIGGWNEGSSRFSPLVADPDRRRELVKNAVKFLRLNHFDGLDLDWEYPAFRDGGKPRDKDNYADLVQELREEFERESSKTGRPRLLLSMAVPAGKEYIDKGYDMPRLNEYLDFINLLSYDYHSAFEPAVNHHSPLYPLEEDNEYNYDTELTINFTINHLLEKGASSDKIVLGIPTYGRSYTLFNEDAIDIGAPADGPGEEGEATREKGYLAYYEICENIANSDEWEVVQANPNAVGPYAVKKNQWVGYDDENIVRVKARYVNEKKLGGIMFWSIDNDDFRGKCHGRPYPLIEAAKEALLLGSSSNAQETKVESSRKKLRTQGTAGRKHALSNKRTTTTTTTTAAPTTRKRISSSRSKFRSRAREQEREDEEDRDAERRSYEPADTEETNTRNVVRNVEKTERSRPRNRPRTRSKSSTERSNRRKQSRNKDAKNTPEQEEEESLSNKLTTPEPPTTPDPGSDFKCEDEGFFPHPRDCKKYFWCLDSGPGGLGVVAHQFTCPSGLVFNKAADSCDYPRNVICPKNKVSKSVASTTRAPITAATSRTTYLHSTTRRTTTEKPQEEDEEDDEEYYDEEEEEEVEEEEPEQKEDPKTITTSKPLLYKTITRNRPSATTTTTTTTTTNKPEESKPELISATVEEEDPKIIKELIDLIKKAGGIEQLEKQLQFQDKNFDNKSSSGSATPATISRTLFERVLNRQNAKSTGNLPGASSLRTKYQNGPGRAQFEGLDEIPEVKSLRRSQKPQYVTIERTKPSTEEPVLDDEEVEDGEDVDDEDHVDSSDEQSISNPVGSSSTQRVTPNYVTIRRNRPQATTVRNENDVGGTDDEVEEESPIANRRPVFPSKNPADRVSEDESKETLVQKNRGLTTEGIVHSTTSRYVGIQRFRSTTPKPSSTIAEKIAETTTKAVITENSEKTSTLDIKNTTESKTILPSTTVPTSSSIATSPLAISTTVEAPTTIPPNTENINNNINIEEIVTSLPPTTENPVKLVEDSVTEILLNTAPVIAKQNIVPSPKATVATVSQPRPFGFIRRNRPSNSISSSTTTLAPSVESSRNKVASSEILKLPTLKEVVGYRSVNHYFTTPTSELLNILSNDIHDETALQDFPESNNAKRTIELETRNDTSDDRLGKTVSVVKEEIMENEGKLAGHGENFSRKKVNKEKRKHQSEGKRLLEVNTIIGNDIFTEDSLRTRKRKTRVNHDGSSTTVKPTTMRSTPHVTKSSDSVTRGFFITRRDFENPPTTISIEEFSTTDTSDFTTQDDLTFPTDVSTTIENLATTENTFGDANTDLVKTDSNVENVEFTTLSPIPDDPSTTSSFSTTLTETSKDTSSPTILESNTISTSRDFTTVESTSTSTATSASLPESMNEEYFKDSSERSPSTLSPVIGTDSAGGLELNLPTITRPLLKNISNETNDSFSTEGSNIEKNRRKIATSRNQHETSSRRTNGHRRVLNRTTNIGSRRHIVHQAIPGIAYPRHRATSNRGRVRYRGSKRVSSTTSSSLAESTNVSSLSTLAINTFNINSTRKYLDNLGDTTLLISAATSSPFLNTYLDNVTASTTSLDNSHIPKHTIVSYDNSEDALKESKEALPIVGGTQISHFHVNNTSDPTEDTTAVFDMAEKLHPRDLRVNNISSPVNEVITMGPSSRISGSQKRTQLYNTLRDKSYTPPLISLLPTTKYPSTIGYRKTYTTEPTLLTIQVDDANQAGKSQETTPNSYLQYGIDKYQKTESNDQSSRAQEIALSLSDPPSSQTSSSNTGQSSFKETYRRKISTTVAPRKTSPSFPLSTLKQTTIFNKRPQLKVKETYPEIPISRPKRPQIIDYDYYADEAEPIVGKSAFNGKLYLTNSGRIQCLDQGNFPHPFSCKKFITCARMVNGLVIGSEYTCPDKLSFDPVGGICNWSAGLGCKE